MDDTQFAEIAAWITCRARRSRRSGDSDGVLRARLALGLPLARGQVFIDTLHPVYGGRGYYWQAAKGETVATEYGPAIEGEMLERGDATRSIT